MNRKIILVIIGACIIITSFAAKKKGCYINHEGDTIRVVFRIPTPLFSKKPTWEKLQWKVKYFDEDHQSHTLLPGQAKEYRFEYNSGTVRMVSAQNVIEASRAGFTPEAEFFLRLVEDGRLKLYKYFEYSGFKENPEIPDPVLREAPGSEEIYLLQKGNEGLFRPGDDASCNDVRDYLSDCPGFPEVVGNIGCKGTDLVRLVKSYNESCLKSR